MESPDETLEQWWNIPENKLELIDGQLIISTLAGSRQVAWHILSDYGPTLALPLASSELWWAALEQAFQPERPLDTPEQWAEWAVRLEYIPEPSPNGSFSLTDHLQVFRLLRDGLYHLAESRGLGEMFSRDFVIRLGENGLTPDLVFIDNLHLANLREYYLDGPSSLAIEIAIKGSIDIDRRLKWQLYEQAGLPEYWLIDPANQQITFCDLEADGRYHPVVTDRWGKYQPVTNGRRRPVSLNQDGVYHSQAVPGLALSVPRLWTMTKHDWTEPWWPFLPVEQISPDKPYSRHRPPNDLGWDSLPFAPRVALQPTPIKFAEYISWAPRAKFERYGGGIKIDGSEGTRRVMGLLLMTFGLVEIVKLTHPFEWVVFLNEDTYQPFIQPHLEELLKQARYQSWEVDPGGPYLQGEIPQLPNIWAFGHTLAECQQNMAEITKNWLLLRFARRQELPK